MRMRYVVVSMMVVGLGAGAGSASGQVTDSAGVAGAERFIGLLKAGDWAAAGQMVAPDLRDRLGAPQLETVWAQITGSLGAAQGTRVRAVTAIDSMKSVELYGDFERDTVVLRVVLSPAMEVVGFWVGPVPDAAPEATPSPPYADATKFRDGEVRVGADPWELPGTLSVPVGVGPHPAVVLVHGSGPHDRDETVGGTKVFRDLAEGLASRGVAVLRYEKRTKVHGAKMGGDVTLDSEVIEDALAALELVRTHPAIDADRVYVLGHSLGAQLGPEIARRDGRVAGAILLAAPARPIDVLMLEQLRHLAGLPENASAEAQAELNAVMAQVRRLVDGTAPDTATVLGAPASYFREVKNRDGVAEARRLGVPLLVLQGERDYQVTMEDFGIWQNAMSGRTDVSLVSFPSLNHLFVAGSGPATPAEYAKPGFVAEDAVRTIAEWIASPAR